MTFWRLMLFLLISLAINGALFAVAFRRQTDKLTDISYALSFVAIVACAFVIDQITSVQLLLGSMVIIWAARLGTYLLVRINKMGHDIRFNRMRSDFRAFGKFWLSQAIAVWVVLLPVLLIMAQGSTTLDGISLLGVAIWAAGLIIEAFADQQKFQFTNWPSNKGKWIESGLWKYSRHPNYLGEMLVWAGVYLAAVPNLSGWSLAIGAISPLFIMGLLIFATGIPPLEKNADKRWGAQPAYQAYKARTSILLLLPNKRH